MMNPLMKSSHKPLEILPLFILIFLYALPLPHPAFAQAATQTQLLDQVVAVVNDEAITQSELDILLRPIYEQYKNDYKGEKLIGMLNDARQKLLNQLVEDHLVFQEAAKQNIKVEEDEIDGEMEEFGKRFPNAQAMEEALRKEGLSLTDMRERLRRQTMIRRLHDLEIRSKIVVSPLEIEEYYKNHPEEFSKQERIRVRSITVKKSEEAREKGLTDEPAKDKVEGLRKKVLKGGDFGHLAQEQSEDSHSKEGGLSEWVERGAMIPAIDDVIFKIKPKEVSEIIETPMGYHFFRVEERQEGEKLTLDKARDEIFGKLFHEKTTARFREWVTELKRNAYISIR